MRKNLIKDDKNTTKVFSNDGNIAMSSRSYPFGSSYTPSIGGDGDSSYSNKNMYIVGGVILLILLVGYLMWWRRPEKKSESMTRTTRPEEVKIARPTSGGKPAMIMFHAHWCGACKQTLPAWKQFVEAAAGAPAEIYDLESKTFDAAAEGIKGFPTIRFYPHGYTPGSKDFVQYPLTEQRNVPGFMQFLQNVLSGKAPVERFEPSASPAVPPFPSGVPHGMQQGDPRVPAGMPAVPDPIGGVPNVGNPSVQQMGGLTGMGMNPYPVVGPNPEETMSLKSLQGPPPQMGPSGLYAPLSGAPSGEINAVWGRSR